MRPLGKKLFFLVLGDVLHRAFQAFAVRLIVAALFVLRLTARDREERMKRFIGPLERKLSDAGIRYQLKGRTKTAYSIWRKMVTQEVPFEKVYDVYAIRFIIDCPPDRETEHALCWNVFSYVTSEYKYDTSRLRDWLSKPKPNGYESLHVTIEFDDGVPLEVQIRTRRMDIVAESGGASHWSYKGVKKEEVKTKKFKVEETVYRVQ